MSVRIGSIALVSAVVVSVTCLQTETVSAADECLAAPNGPAPQGSRWYYRLDRANHRKCWYTRAPDQSSRLFAPQAAPEASAAASSAPMALAPADDDVPSVPSPRGAANAQKNLPVAAARPVAPPAEPASTAAATIWPDPPRIEAPAPLAAQADEPRAEPIPAQPNISAPAGAQANMDTRVTGISAPERKPEAAGSFLSMTPLGMVLIGAIGLGLAGILSRAVVRIAARRRNEERYEPHWSDHIPSDHIPHEPSPSIASHPRDITYLPEDHEVREDVAAIEAALRRFITSRERRAAA